MDFIGYRSDALGAAVALVNAITPERGADPARTPAPDLLRGVLAEHGYLVDGEPDAVEDELADWAARLRTAFDAADTGTDGPAPDGTAPDRTAPDTTAADATVDTAAAADTTAAAVNALLARARTAPHLTRHDGQRWHLHYTPPEAGLVDRVRATTAFALALLVSEYGTDRHGRCAAGGCSRVYADSSRNAARRYCSSACANRAAVAAHRARARRGG